MMEYDSEMEKILKTAKVRIKVIGCGGAGCNSVTNLKKFGLSGAKLIALNTDAAHLKDKTDSDVLMLIGERLTNGHGAKADPNVGRDAAIESRDSIMKATANADLVFIIAGMGGGTGTGSAPIVAQAAKANGAQVICFVTLPTKSEGEIRKQNAKIGLESLTKVSHTVIVISNERLKQINNKKNEEESYAMADKFIVDQISGIVNTITDTSLINVEFSDLMRVLSHSRAAYVGVGESSGGEKRMDFALNDALTNQLIDVDISKAKGCLMRVIGGNFTIDEFDDISKKMLGMMNEDCEFIVGADMKEEMGDAVKIFLIITGVDSNFIIGNGDDIDPHLFGDDDSDNRIA
ncbi:MAG: cell division FtsZ family protein [Candidatus Thermoplasmatota archaeon]|nr:cell division FtsZ family protein [Candidatus Thermoplasmatota archaeon]